MATPQTAGYQFVSLPRHPSPHLQPQQKHCLEMLKDVSEAKQFCDHLLEHTATKPSKGTHEAAAWQLREAVALHGTGASLRSKFQLIGVKHLRFVRSGRARADVKEWTPAHARVGDLILVRMEDQEQPWEVAIVIDPITGLDNPRGPAVHVPAGAAGREKVSQLYHGVHRHLLSSSWELQDIGVLLVASQ